MGDWGVGIWNMLKTFWEHGLAHGGTALPLFSCLISERGMRAWQWDYDDGDGKMNFWHARFRGFQAIDFIRFARDKQ